MPIDAPYRVRFQAQTVARIHVVTPRGEIQTAMHAAIHEISTVLQAAGVARNGPWFAHHRRQPTDTFDFDVCFPITGHLQPTGRVESAEIPGADVVRTVHHGAYQGLPQAWQDFMDWISANGVKMRGDMFEVYTVGPQANDGPDTYETELNCPLVE